MGEIVLGEKYELIKPFEVFFLYTGHREEHGGFVECLYERENIVIGILHSNYAELSTYDEEWLRKLQSEYRQYIQMQKIKFDDSSIDNEIISMIRCSKWKDQIHLMTSMTWKPGTLGHVISSLERQGFEYSSYSNIKNFDQSGLRATMIISNDDETIISSDSGLDFSEKPHSSRVKQVIEQAVPRTLVVMDNHEGKWFVFELDRRSLLGLERGSLHHLHFSSNLNSRVNLSKLIRDFKSLEHMSHGYSTHIVFSEFEETMLSFPIKL